MEKCGPKFPKFGKYLSRIPSKWKNGAEISETWKIFSRIPFKCKNMGLNFRNSENICPEWSRKFFTNFGIVMVRDSDKHATHIFRLADTSTRWWFLHLHHNTEEETVTIVQCFQMVLLCLTKGAEPIMIDFPPTYILRWGPNPPPLPYQRNQGRIIR